MFVKGQNIIRTSLHTTVKNKQRRNILDRPSFESVQISNKNHKSKH